MTTRQYRMLAAISGVLWLVLVTTFALRTWRVWRQQKQVSVLLTASKQVSAQHSGEARRQHSAINNLPPAESLVKPLEAAEEKQTGINARDANGETALLRTVLRSNCARMRYLLARHADPNIATCGGCTPLLEAAQEENLEAVQLLLSHGARVDTKDVDGETALIYAIEQRTVTADPQIVSELVRAGANVNARDWKKRTALAIAIRNNRPDIVRMLRSAGAKPQIAPSHRLIEVETSDNAAP